MTRAEFEKLIDFQELHDYPNRGQHSIVGKVEFGEGRTISDMLAARPESADYFDFIKREIREALWRRLYDTDEQKRRAIYEAKMNCVLATRDYSKQLDDALERLCDLAARP